MPLYPLASSSLESADHDPASGTLTVKFKNGRRWRYVDVPGDVVTELVEAESAGSFFARNIRGQFEGEPLPEPDAD